jgi:hypothetical protein
LIVVDPDALRLSATSAALSRRQWRAPCYSLTPMLSIYENQSDAARRYFQVTDEPTPTSRT